MALPYGQWTLNALPGQGIRRLPLQGIPLAGVNAPLPSMGSPSPSITRPEFGPHLDPQASAGRGHHIAGTDTIEFTQGHE